MFGLTGRVVPRVILVCAVFLECATGQLVVDTPVGKISGQAVFGLNLNSFLGIPFAKPPIGPLRFKRTSSAEAFSTTFAASEYGPPCVPNVGGEEDCLFLNLFVPENASHSSPLAVMVWVHGGGFQSDTAARYDGSILASQGDVIVVTLNYRLGVFGFLNTGDDASLGNYGLWDQRLALEWVQKNIASFGGDPGRVTLIGESAGAAGAAYHALFPRKQTLYQTMILQSGTAIAPFAFNRKPRKYALEFAERVGCNESSGVVLIECLQSQNVADLTEKSRGMLTDLGMSVIDFTWVPSVDGEFIIDDPNKLIANNTFLRDIGFFDANLLLGMNNDEGSLVFKLAKANGVDKKGVSLDPINGVSKSFFENDFIPAIVSQKFGASTNETNLATSYTYEKTTASENRENVSNAEWFQTYSDATFLSPITRHALTHSSGRGSGKTYLYLFDHHPSNIKDPEVTGTPHGGDVPYVFGFLAPTPAISFIGPESNFSDNVIRYWSNMARSGTPNGPEDVFVVWPEFSPSDQSFLKLSTEMSSHSIGKGLFSKRAKFWLDFLPAIFPGEVDDTPRHEPRSSITPPKSEAFIKRFNIDSPTAEATIIALAVVVALLAVVILLVIVAAMYLKRRRKTKSNYSLS